MPRGGLRTPSGGRPKGSIGKGKGAPENQNKTIPEEPAGLMVDQDGQTPIEYMLEVMRDPDADKSRRDRMAVALAPFVHAKHGELGKKDERKQAAKVAAGGKFAPAPPPKLVINNK